jgi:hypothetical protein
MPPRGRANDEASALHVFSMLTCGAVLSFGALTAAARPPVEDTPIQDAAHAPISSVTRLDSGRRPTAFAQAGAVPRLSMVEGSAATPAHASEVANLPRRRRREQLRRDLMKAKEARPAATKRGATHRNATRVHGGARAAPAAAAVIDVCFLALGPPKQMDASTTIIRNIEAHRSNSTVRYHLLVDKPTRVLRKEMRYRAAWRGVPKRAVSLHSIAELPPAVRALHSRLSRTATGPGPLYLWKPLLHLVLPRSVSRVIVLDTDIFLFEDIAGLARQFDAFAPGELLGVAPEQAPSYQEVRALGGVGFNGGVQLLALEEMRRSAHYKALMETYSAFPIKAPMKPGGIGWLGDQTLYSWMSVNGTGAAAVFHLLPCGWNRQIGTHMAGWPGFWRSHRCAERCRLLHGNFLSHKRLMESLKADPSGRTCRATVERYRGDKDFKRGSADARMLDMIDRSCCRTFT